jgi:DNA-binding transcriptional regulator YhcF (GntR family)
MDLADATGLSTVHLNRTLQELRSAGLITLRDRSLTIVDPQALRNTAMFNPNYLHLERM